MKKTVKILGKTVPLAPLALMVSVVVTASALGILYWSSQPITHEIVILGMDAGALDTEHGSYTAKTNALILDSHVPDAFTLVIYDGNLNSDIQMRINVTSGDGIGATAQMAWASYYIMSGTMVDMIACFNDLAEREYLLSTPGYNALTLTYRDVSAALNVNGANPDALVVIPLAEQPQMLWETPPTLLENPTTLDACNAAIIMFDFDTTGMAWGNYVITITVDLGTA